MFQMEGKETVLDSTQWLVEAEQQMHDIRSNAKLVEISTLGSDDTGVYINITSLEDKCFCVYLSSHGFRVVGKEHNSTTSPSEQAYESPYALMNAISPGYQASMSNQLFNALASLQQD